MLCRYKLFRILTGYHDNRNILDPSLYWFINVQHFESVHPRHDNIQQDKGDPPVPYLDSTHRMHSSPLEASRISVIVGQHRTSEWLQVHLRNHPQSGYVCLDLLTCRHPQHTMPLLASFQIQSTTDVLLVS